MYSEEINKDELPVISNLKVIRKNDFKIVTRDEFNKLDEEESNYEDYEEYYEKEKEGWADIVRSVLRKPFELLDSLPIKRPWRNTVKKEEGIEIQKHLPAVFEEIITINENGELK